MLDMGQYSSHIDYSNILPPQPITLGATSRQCATFRTEGRCGDPSDQGSPVLPMRVVSRPGQDGHGTGPQVLHRLAAASLGSCSVGIMT